MRTEGKSSRGGKNRRGKIRRGHSFLDGLEDALKPVAALPSVSACIPARISRTAGTGTGLSARTDTPDGVKLSYHRGNAIQDVFVITGEPGKVRELLASAPGAAPASRRRPGR
jgi:hypothetical protein